MSRATTPHIEDVKNVGGRNGTASSPRCVVCPCIFCPLRNLCNTCYFNAGVQLLVNCPPFVYSICNSPFRHSRLLSRTLRLRRHVSVVSQKLFQSLAELMHRMEFTLLSADEAISPSDALDALVAAHSAFEGCQQQDCPEMVNVILANVAEESRLEVDLETLLNSLEADAASVVTDDDVLESYSVSSPLDDSFLQHQYPGSWWDFNTLRLMRIVNGENEMLERREKIRKGQPYQNTFRPPKIFVNSAVDSFTGYMLSEVQCHSCGNTSRIVEEFSSLAIDIPSNAQRLRYARAHPEVQRVSADGSSPQHKRATEFQWLSPLAWFARVTRWFFDLFTVFSHSVNYDITLQECLDIHFEPIVLTGSNKYHCGACNSTSEATKRETLLSIPDYLLIQMKRFEYGHCFNTKKTDPVVFPLSWNTGDAESAEVLRLGAYLHESVAPPKSTLPPSRGEYTEPTMGAAEGFDGESEIEAAAKVSVKEGMGDKRPPGCIDAAGAPCSDEESRLHITPRFPIHTYTLEAVVNHHGSIKGGHYTTYARKKTEQSDVWVHLNDDVLTTVSLNDVANSEEYLLLYKKQPLQRHSDFFYELRNRARLLLATPPQDVLDAKINRAILRNGECDLKGGVQSEDEEIVFISRPWLERMSFLEEPGPILNRLCYCSESQISSDRELQRQNQEQEHCPSATRVPIHVHGPPVEWFFVPLQRKEFNAFYRVYGGNIAVTSEEYDRLRQEQHDAYDRKV